MAVNLFAKAKETAAPATSKSKMKTLVPVRLDDKIKLVNQYREEMESLKTKLSVIEDDVKAEAEEQYIKLFRARNLKPESFVMESNGAKILVIVQDKYLKLTDEKEQVIKSQWKDHAKDLIQETTEFKFNPVLMEKHEAIIGEKLSEAIMSIEGIPEEDKANLIMATPTKVIKKGTIDRLLNFPMCDTLFKLVQPILQLKNQD